MVENKTSNVLIIDDEIFITEILAEFAYSKNLVPLVAHNTLEGLEYLKNYKVDIIISDIMMPGEPGIIILEYLKEKNLDHRIPVIMITAIKGFNDTVMEYISHGVTDIIFKPLDMKLLDQKFDAILNKKSKIEEAFIEKGQNILKDFIHLTRHEINNPLTIAYANIEYLKSAIDNDYHNKEVVIDRLNSLINTIEQIEERVRKMGDVDLETILSLDAYKEVLGIDDALEKKGLKEDFFVWRPQYELGFQTIDDHHKILVGFINEVHDAFKAGDPSYQVKRIFNKLLKYTEFHFGFEEEIFNKIGYSESTEHLRKHRSFELKIKEFMNVYEDNIDNPKFENQVSLFLKDWLLTHILIEDQKYVEDFKNNRIK